VADANLEALPVSHSMIRSVKGIGRPVLTRVETSLYPPLRRGLMLAEGVCLYAAARTLQRTLVRTTLLSLDGKGAHRRTHT
jgi:hypothetical protein